MPVVIGIHAQANYVPRGAERFDIRTAGSVFHNSIEGRGNHGRCEVQQIIMRSAVTFCRKVMSAVTVSISPLI